MIRRSVPVWDLGHNVREHRDGVPRPLRAPSAALVLQSRRRNLEKWRVSEISRLRAAGAKWRDIAGALGVSVTVCRRLLDGARYQAERERRERP